MNKKHYTVADLNPRSQIVKPLETTVIRALGIINAFDALEKGEDWSDVPNVVWRKVIGTRHYENQAVLIEMWARYKSPDMSLHRQTLDLFDNLPPTVWDSSPGDTPNRKRELEGRYDDINRIREEFNSRSKRRRARADARGN